MVHWIKCEYCPPPPNSYVEILTLNVILFGGGGSQRLLGHKGGVLMNGISALYERGPTELPCVFCLMRTQQ